MSKKEGRSNFFARTKDTSLHIRREEKKKSPWSSTTSYLIEKTKTFITKLRCPNENGRKSQTIQRASLSPKREKRLFLSYERGRKEASSGKGTGMRALKTDGMEVSFPGTEKASFRAF